jgi:hypothetical protein
MLLVTLSPVAELHRKRRRTLHTHQRVNRLILRRDLVTARTVMCSEQALSNVSHPVPLEPHSNSHLRHVRNQGSDLRVNERHDAS